MDHRREVTHMCQFVRGPLIMEGLDLVTIRPGDHVPNQTPMVVGEFLTTL